MQIRELADRRDYPRWDAFVTESDEATFFHLAGWRDVIGETFRQPTYFLFAERSGTIVGVLPLAHLRSRLFGRRLVSLPFCAYGGVAAADEEARAALVRHAGELARRLRVDFLELRNLSTQQDLPTSDRYVTFRKALDPDPQRNMDAIPRKQRAMIRKAIAKGLVSITNAPVTDFYRVYSQSLRDLGTPVLPLRYFETLKRVFGDSCEIATVGTQESRAPIAAVMSFYFRDAVLPYYGGGTPKARAFHAYDFMYWELLVHALRRGVRVFDFGRSRRGTGSFRFKTHWGFEPLPLPYQYDLVRAEGLPNVTPDNPKYQALIKLWRYLPVPVTTMIGPWFARNLG
jgi:FemAB-related protein (PEP-CTERM system-associated)